jgi:hypothetical protein
LNLIQKILTAKVANHDKPLIEFHFTEQFNGSAPYRRVLPVDGYRNGLLVGKHRSVPTKTRRHPFLLARDCLHHSKNENT